MQKIVSVSRRTDVPAFYGDWFLEQVRRGGAAVLHPYRREKLFVSLKPDDVAAFVFWSKNYAPFLKHLEELERRGYNFVLLREHRHRDLRHLPLPLPLLLRRHQAGCICARGIRSFCL